MRWRRKRQYLLYRTIVKTPLIRTIFPRDKYRIITGRQCISQLNRKLNEIDKLMKISTMESTDHKFAMRTLITWPSDTEMLLLVLAHLRRGGWRGPLDRWSCFLHAFLAIRIRTVKPTMIDEGPLMGGENTFCMVLNSSNVKPQVWECFEIPPCITKWIFY